MESSEWFRPSHEHTFASSLDPMISINREYTERDTVIFPFPTVLRNNRRSAKHSRTNHFRADQNGARITTLTSIRMTKIVSPAHLMELAIQVDKRIPKDLAFFRYGDRMLQIKRYLIEHELDVSQAVMAIKRTAAWRKAWNADTSSLRPEEDCGLRSFYLHECEFHRTGCCLRSVQSPTGWRVPPAGESRGVFHLHDGLPDENDP